MLEKEAEEYLKVQCKKRKEEYVIRMPEVYIADIPQAFKDGAELGYKKANEWHYMKDGDLPKVNELVLIKITGCFVLGWTNGTNWFNDSNNGTIIDRRMVIAWKEIVLPELKESE